MSLALWTQRLPKLVLCVLVASSLCIYLLVEDEKGLIITLTDRLESEGFAGDERRRR